MEKSSWKKWTENPLVRKTLPVLVSDHPWQKHWLDVEYDRSKFPRKFLEDAHMDAVFIAFVKELGLPWVSLIEFRTTSLANVCDRTIRRTPLVGHGRIFHVELSEKAGVAGLRSAHPFAG